MKIFCVLITILAILPTYGWAQTFSSSDKRTDLIELYTSEGCSSCPPAERRMNEYMKHKGLWTDFVPVAFHVDYWNYIGWNDRFSDAAYSMRQRTYSKQWKASTIYTPCFVVNGKTTRNPDRLRLSNKPGVLKATLTNGLVKVTFTPEKSTSGKLQVWIAPLSGEESSNITSGENRGRILEHCFVVLGLHQKSMIRGNIIYSASLPYSRMLDHKALAIWVTKGKDLSPIQATGGWLP